MTAPLLSTSLTSLLFAINGSRVSSTADCLFMKSPFVFASTFFVPSSWSNDIRSPVGDVPVVVVPLVRFESGCSTSNK